MGHRHYSDDEKAEILAWYESNGRNIKKTSRECHVPAMTLHGWINGSGVNDSVRASVPEKKGEIGDRLEELCHKLIDAALEKAKGADLQPIMTGIGIAVEKMRLAREQATSISKNASLTDEQRAARVDELLERARARRSGQPDPIQPVVQ